MSIRKKKILYLLIFTSFLFFVLNFNYFYSQVRYGFFGRKIIFSDKKIKRVEKFGERNWLKVPALNISAPILYIEEKKESVFQEALKSGVVHYPGTALPGQNGNVYIFGHSSDYFWNKGSYKTVFALLPKISKGEEVEISDNFGKIYTYEVVESFVAEPKDLYLLNQDYSKKQLTLQTSYPIGTALKRWIVIAEIKNSP